MIMVGEIKYKELVKDVHTKLGSPKLHAGQRSTFEAVSKRYFAFGGRRIVAKTVAMCPIRNLNSYPKTNAEKDGNQIAMEPNAAGAVDIIGPLRGFVQMAK